MSFGVPGLKFSTSDIGELIYQFQEFERWVDQSADTLLLNYISKRVAHAIDTAVVNDQPLPEYPTSKVYEDFNRKVKEIREGRYHAEEDFRITIVVIPFEGSLYGTVHTCQDQWAKHLRKQSWCRDYRWNDGDSSHIEDQVDWLERGRVWEAVFKNSSIPERVGLVRRHDPLCRTPLKSEIVANMPSRGERARIMAKDMLRTERYKERTIRDFDSTVLFQIIDELETPEGLLDIERKAVELGLILPEITVDLL